jgi:hypothetical protein
MKTLLFIQKTKEYKLNKNIDIINNMNVLLLSISTTNKYYCVFKQFKYSINTFNKINICF